MDEKVTTYKRNVEEYFSLKEIFRLCLIRWKWILLSLLITVGAATAYLMITPVEYKRSASILIKESDKPGASLAQDIGGFADMGLFSKSTNVHNELVSLRSPATLLEVIKRLNLDIDYKVDGRFHRSTLYGSELPIVVSIDRFYGALEWSLSLTVRGDGMVEVSDMILDGEPMGEGQIFLGELVDSIPTPMGIVRVGLNSAYSDEMSIQTPMTIHVSRSNLSTTMAECQKRLQVGLINDKTSILELSYTDVSIERAEDFLDTLISVYNENWVKDKNKIAVSTSQFINERLSVIEQELGAVDSDISSFKSKNLIPDVRTASEMYMTQAGEAGTQILALNNQLYMARYIRGHITGGQGRELLPVNSGINSPVIEREISEYNETLLQLNRLLSNSSEKNPLVIDMDRTLTAMRRSILLSIDNEINSLSNQIRTLRAQESKSTSRIASSPTQAQYLLSVERQQKIKEALYLFLLQKREENELSQAFTAYNTRVITPPMGELTPIFPRKRNILLGAFLLGLLVPVAFIYVGAVTDTKVRGRKDLEGMTTPFLGEIPQNGDSKGLRAIKRRRKYERYEIVVQAQNRNAINEAFRVTRANLEFMLGVDGHQKVMMLTSLNGGSGKTFVTMNLAASFAINNKRVVVIDLDMRRGMLSTYVDSPEVGLSALFSGQLEDWRSIIVPSDDLPDLHVLPVGKIPPNPTELLYSSRLSQLLEALRQEYDYIFIDCPPVEIVADAYIIEKLVDKVIFVIRAGLTDREMLSVVDAFYNNKKLNNMSLILNGTSSMHGNHGYGYDYKQYISD